MGEVEAGKTSARFKWKGHIVLFFQAENKQRNPDAVAGKVHPVTVGFQEPLDCMGEEAAESVEDQCI